MSLRTPLSRARGLGSAKSGAEHWWMQRVTAVSNLFLVVFFVLLIVSLIGADHAQVAARLSHPVVATGLIALVISVTWHMRLGMQVVIEDYVHGEGAKVACLLANTYFCAAIAIASIFAVLKLGFGA